jgi:hypothetical protein
MEIFVVDVSLTCRQDLCISYMISAFRFFIVRHNDVEAGLDDVVYPTSSENPRRQSLTYPTRVVVFLGCIDMEET